MAVSFEITSIYDAIDAMVKAIDYGGNERLFNVGRGKGHSINEILDEIESLIGRPVERKYTLGSSLDVPVNVLDIEQAERCLQWQPNTTFRQGLERTLAWINKGDACQL